MRGRMLEYERFKAAALELMRRHEEGGFAFTSAVEAEVIPAEKLHIDGDGLAAAFQLVLDRLPAPTEVAVELHRYSLAEEARAIRARLAGGEALNFTAIFDGAGTRLHAVVIFLALLELVRTGEVRLRQRGPLPRSTSRRCQRPPRASRDGRARHGPRRRWRSAPSGGRSRSLQPWHRDRGQAAG